MPFPTSLFRFFYPPSVSNNAGSRESNNHFNAATAYSALPSASASLASSADTQHLTEVHPFQISNHEPIDDSTTSVSADALTAWLDEGVFQYEEDGVAGAAGVGESEQEQMSNSTSSHLIRANMAQNIFRRSSQAGLMIRNVDLPKALLEVHTILRDFVPLADRRSVTIQSLDAAGGSLLGHAAQKGAVSALGLCAALGLSVNHKAANGSTPTLKAAEKGQLRALKKLHQLGANMKLADDDLQTLRQVAQINGHTEAAALIQSFEQASSRVTPPTSAFEQRNSRLASSHPSNVAPARSLRNAVPLIDVVRTFPPRNSEFLPIISSMDQYIAFNELLGREGNAPRPLVESINAAIAMMQDPDITNSVGLESDEFVDAIGEVFAAHQIPIGCMNSLWALSNFDGIQFIIDDSGSMDLPSDERDGGTRWNAAQHRIKNMIDVLSLIPSPPITLQFLNSEYIIQLNRTANDTLSSFRHRVLGQISHIFSRPPRGTTPLLEGVSRSMSDDRGQRIARYILCDGWLTGGRPSIHQLSQLITNRANPLENPLTFLSLSDDDQDVEWMNDIAARSPGTTSLGSYEYQAEIVRQYHGSRFPYTTGLHLMAQLLGSIMPVTLGALTEPVPLTKSSFDNILGIRSSNTDYERYFTGLVREQSAIQRTSGIQTGQFWTSHFSEFLTAPLAQDIPQVRAFRARLEHDGFNHRTAS